jgi:hypothetical protein
MQNISYPSIRVSECKHHDFNIMPIGIRYCPKCNSIILFVPHMRKYFKEIEDDIVEILTHEEMHWWLCKNINEEASIDFDGIYESSEDSKQDIGLFEGIPSDFNPFPLASNQDIEFPECIPSDE